MDNEYVSINIDMSPTTAIVVFSLAIVASAVYLTGHLIRLGSHPERE
jgi:hypothetical protein